MSKSRSELRVIGSSIVSVASIATIATKASATIATVSVQGAKTTDQCFVSATAPSVGFLYKAYCSAAGTVLVTCTKISTGTAAPADTTLNVIVVRH